MMQLAALLEAAIRQCESHARCSCDVHVGVMRGEPQTIHATEISRYSKTAHAQRP